MEVAPSPVATAFSFSTNSKFSIKRPKTTIQTCNLFPIAYKLNSKKKNIDKHSSAISFSFNSDNLLVLPPHPSSISTISSFKRTRAASTSTPSTFFTSSCAAGVQNRYWMVVMETPPQGVSSKPQIVDYYVETLQRVLGSEEDAQMCIYDASCDTHFGFCCDIDEEASRELARLPGVLSVVPDPDFSSTKKNYSNSKVQLGLLSNTLFGSAPLFPAGNSKHWLVQMENPAIGVVTKAQMVDHYTQVLTKVMGNEKDAQMCMYHISWQSNFGFCCELDEECAKELAGLPGVLSVQPDKNFESLNKEYGGEKLQQFGGSPNSSAANETTNIKTKKLFVTGLSFYTSEKTLRAAFEGFGELTEVKVIMDKISKRSKGYAFVEYTTEAAAAAALKEMNGKIINGWMITVDIAKSKPPKYSSGRPRPAI